MNWTKQEIKNSKRIAELGERKVTEEGDFVFIEWQGEGIRYIDHDYKAYPSTNHLHILGVPRDTIISSELWFPLWTWQDCREWLNKREYRLFQLHEEFVTRNMKICLCGKTSDYHIEIIGKTDTEAIQKCVIKVLEEEKKGD